MLETVRVCIALALVVGACGPPPVHFLNSTLPTAVVVAEGPAGRLTTVIDRRSAATSQLEVDGEVHPRVWVLEYDETTSELGLPARTLVENPAGLPLPEPSIAHQLGYDGSWADTWESERNLPEALREVRFRETSPCPTFSFQQRSFGEARPAQPAFAVPLDDDRILVGSDAGEFFEVRREDDRALTGLSTSTPHQAAFATESGEIWLLASSGECAHGRPESGFAPGPRLPAIDGGWVELTGSIDAGPLELYALGDGLEVARYSDGRWTLLDSPGVADATRAGKDIAWVERGLVVSIGRASNELVEHRASGGYSTITLQLPAQFNQDAPWKLQHLKGVGVYFGSRHNVLFERREGRWIDLPQLNIAPKADVMADLGGGQLISGGNGTLAHWIDGFGYCEPLTFPTGGTLRDAVALPGQLFIFSMDRDGGALVNHFDLARP